MDKKKKMLMMMVCILGVYIIALATGIMFILFLLKGEFIRAGIVLLIEVCLFFIGTTLRKKLF